MRKVDIEKYYGDLNHLFRRVVDTHPARMSRNKLLRATDKEFQRLARAMKLNRFSRRSFDILIVDSSNYDNGSIRVRSRTGYTMEIKREHAILLELWAFADDDARSIQMKEHISLGGRTYGLHDISPHRRHTGNPNMWHDIVEKASRILGTS